MSESWSRRAVLKLGAAGFVAGGLSACIDRDGVPTAGDAVPSPSRPDGVDDASWSAVRAQFLLAPGIAYMNNASLGMPPRQVVDAVAAGYRAISQEPLHGKHALQDAIDGSVMPRLAALLGVVPGEISLTRNATEALHLQAIGARLRPGDEVLVTTQEHPAGSRPWLFREGMDGIRVTPVFVPSPLPSVDEIVGRMAAEVSPRTRAIAFCHVTRGGHLYPVAELCAMAKERGLLSLVDGAQAVGQLPVDLHALGCDAYSASLHKWMLGPVGTGFMYVRESARAEIVTAFAPDATLAAPQLAPPGTVDLPVRAAIGAALDFVSTLGLDQVEARCRHLSDYLKERLSETPGVRLLSGERDRSAPGSTIFEKSGLNAMASVPLMEEAAAVHIDEHQRDGHDAIRVSTHIYNTTEEIDRLVRALREA